MFTRRFVWLLLAALAVLQAGCNPTQASATLTLTPTATASPRPAWTLTPYPSPTSTPTPLPPTPPQLPTAGMPSPTPWTYQVQSGDTMLGIALRFGIPLEELKQANPGVDPQFLSVGTRLLIPINADNPAGLPTPTPMPLTVGTPFCAPAVDGGVVCLVTVTNPGAQAVEAVSVWVALENGPAQAAEALNDLLPAGGTTAAVIRFAPPAPSNPNASARLLRALPVDDQRLQTHYLPTTLNNTTTIIAANARSAQIKGVVAVTEGKARQVWVVAVAYDALGRPVGARRWEARGAETAKGKPIAFTLTVYSIGPAIEKVSLFAEAHAVDADASSP